MDMAQNAISSSLGAQKRLPSERSKLGWSQVLSRAPGRPSDSSRKSRTQPSTAFHLNEDMLETRVGGSVSHTR